jgi:hypothetical protein
MKASSPTDELAMTLNNGRMKSLFCREGSWGNDREWTSECIDRFYCAEYVIPRVHQELVHTSVSGSMDAG